MKKYLALVFLLISMIGYSQNQSETESFIKKYIEAFPQNNGVDGEANRVSFRTTKKDGYVLVYTNKLPYAGTTMTYFAPRDVESIIIDKAQMKNKNCIIRVNLKPNATATEIFNYRNEKYIDKINIIVGNSSFNEKFPERIKKAIENLVKLDGGIILEDKF